MRTIVTAAAVAAGVLCAPLAHTQGPNQGDQCMNWHATTPGPDGQTMTCTHLPQSDPSGGSGHIMYWEYGGARDSAYRTAPSGYKTAPCVAGSSATCNACLMGSQDACAALGSPPPADNPATPPSFFPCGGTGLPPVAGPPTPGSPCRR